MSRVRRHWDILQKESRKWRVDDNGNNPLHLAVLAKDLPLIERYSNSDMIYQQNRNEESPFHLCFQTKDSGVFRALLKIVDVKTINLKDTHGNTCLHLARQFGWNDICEELIAKGANPDLRNNDGNTADEIIPNTPSEIASTDEQGYNPK